MRFSEHIRKTLPILLTLVSANACSECPVVSSDPNVAMFAESPMLGRWVIDQPAHALYEATEYFFEDDGSIRHGISVVLGSSAEYRTGVVAPDIEGCTSQCVESDGDYCCLPYTCDFGDNWMQLSDNVLIDVDCTDGVSRAFSFSINELNQPTNLIIGDAPAFHPGFMWRWNKCDDPALPQSCNAMLQTR